jgi:diguanylate cyclase (GGDEF)-like protein
MSASTRRVSRYSISPVADCIYLCDDDPQQRRQIIEQLSCFGYQVTGFDDPLELVEAVRSTPPDVIIMDIIFPGGENYGLEVIRRLQTQLDQPIPTIFISGRGDFDARLRAVRAGGIAYCTKPVIPIDLVDILDNLGERAEPEPYRVLVVDDDPDLVTYIDMVLREAGMEVKISTRPHEVLDTLPHFNADLVLMDLYMSDCVGAELARVLRQIPGYIGLPIVYLSGETDRERQFSALSVGADGFLTKPIQPDQLINTVTLRAERMRSLRRLMVRDSLTGLYNHSNCKLLLDQGFSHAHRRKSPLSLAMIDLDHFKQINDDYGHAVGDQVIIGLSRLLRQRLRKSDIIGRYGGEEFVVILPDTPAEDAIQIMDQLRTGFATILFHAAEGDFHVTFSCGVASSATCNSSSQLRSLADSALYQAKSRGRNCCLVSEQGEGSSGG